MSFVYKYSESIHDVANIIWYTSISNGWTKENTSSPISNSITILEIKNTKSMDKLHSGNFNSSRACIPRLSNKFWEVCALKGRLSRRSQLPAAAVIGDVSDLKYLGYWSKFRITFLSFWSDGQMALAFLQQLISSHILLTSNNM